LIFLYLLSGPKAQATMTNFASSSSGEYLSEGNCYTFEGNCL